MTKREIETAIEKCVADLAAEFCYGCDDRKHLDTAARVLPIVRRHFGAFAAEPTKGWTSGPTQDGGLFLSANNGSIHLEVSMSADGAVDWFFRNRKTDETDSGETDSNHTLRVGDLVIRHAELVRGDDDDA